MTKTPSAPIASWLTLAVLVILVDQITKTLITHHFLLGDGQAITSYFNLVRVHNTGAAFSFLRNASGWQRWLFTGIGLGATSLIVWLLRRHGRQFMFSLALSLILGGALGNVIDRLLHGHVIDFLDFHWRWLTPLFTGGHFPAFNVADSAIFLGACFLILDEIFRARRAQRGVAKK